MRGWGSGRSSPIQARRVPSHRAPLPRGRCRPPGATASPADSGLVGGRRAPAARPRPRPLSARSEEHTSELQSRLHPVCRLLLAKKKMAGLWINLQFRDGERMEGIIPNNLLQLETFSFTVVPPDQFCNQQLVLIPRGSEISVDEL